MSVYYYVTDTNGAIKCYQNTIVKIDGNAMKPSKVMNLDGKSYKGKSIIFRHHDELD